MESYTSLTILMFREFESLFLFQNSIELSNIILDPEKHVRKIQKVDSTYTDSTLNDSQVQAIREVTTCISRFPVLLSHAEIYRIFCLKLLGHICDFLNLSCLGVVTRT